MHEPDDLPADDLPPDAEEPPPASPVQYRRMLAWGGRLVSWAPLLFAGTVVLAFLQQFGAQFQAKVVEGALAVFRDEPVTGLTATLLPSSRMGIAFLFVGVGLASLAVGFAYRLVDSLCDLRIQRMLNQRLHDKLLTLGPEYHSRHPQGELNVLISNFAPGTQAMLLELYSTPLIRGLSFVTALALLVDSLRKAGAMPPLLQAGLLAGLVLLPVGGWLLARGLKDAYRAVAAAHIGYVNELMNSTANPVEVQLMDARAQRSRAYAARAREYFRAQFRAVLRTEIAGQFQGSSVLLLESLFVFSAAWYAVHHPEAGPQAVASIVGFMLLIPVAVSPLLELLTFFTGIQRSWPSMEPVLDVLEMEPEIRESPTARPLVLAGPLKAGPLEAGPPDLRLEGVRFAYDPPAWVLDGLSHTFEAGAVTAVVARSGGGKSTLLNLLCRLRDPQEGRVLVGGLDVRDCTLASLRRTCAKCSQHPLFILDTIRANLCLAKEDATDGELRALCQRTGLWEVLLRHDPESPLDYVLPANEGLSGGERRLLSVTRSQLYDPAVLLLDEPTTGLDATSRQQLIAWLRPLCQGKTVVLVDHDMNFIRAWADRVLVLEEGRVAEVGSPDELLARPDSCYRALYEDYNAHGSMDEEDRGEAPPASPWPGP